MKKLLVLALLALSAFAASAAEPPAVPAPAVVVAPASAPEGVAPVQPELTVVLGIPAPRLVSTCNDICIADFKICRDSCHSLACYNQCRNALDTCQAGC